MFKKSGKLFILAILSTLILSSCVSVNQSKAHYKIVEGEEIKDTYYYELEESFNGMVLDIRLELLKGQVRFELVDPNGKVRWEELVDSNDKFEKTKEFEKIVGKWDLVFESIDESAEGDLSLEFNKK